MWRNNLPNHLTHYLATSSDFWSKLPRSGPDEDTLALENHFSLVKGVLDPFIFSGGTRGDLWPNHHDGRFVLAFLRECRGVHERKKATHSHHDVGELSVSRFPHHFDLSEQNQPRRDLLVLELQCLDFGLGPRHLLLGLELHTLWKVGKIFGWKDWRMNVCHKRCEEWVVIVSTKLLINGTGQKGHKNWFRNPIFS